MFKSDDEEVKGIISDMVADRTKVTYRNANITFLMWIYDGGTYKSRLLREEYIKEMDEAVTKKEQRNVSKKWLDGIQCEDDCPILLHNLTFKIFSRYLTKRKESTSGRYLSKSTYGSIQSSICHLYRLCDLMFPENFATDLNRMMSGLKKRVQRQKQKKGIRVEEGKTPMSLQVYSLLCDYFMQQPDDDSILCHTFLTLEWNLMARSDNVTSCHLNHIEWRNDSLVIFLPTQKVTRRV